MPLQIGGNSLFQPFGGGGMKRRQNEEELAEARRVIAQRVQEKAKVNKPGHTHNHHHHHHPKPAQASQMTAASTSTASDTTRRVSVGALDDIINDYGTHGKLSQAQAARAAVDMLNQGQNTTFMVLMTMLYGGKDKAGLWPSASQSKDTPITVSDLHALAGNSSDISPESFKTYFKDKAGSGRSFTQDDLRKLQKLASKDTGDTPDTSTANTSTATVVRQLIAILTSLFSNFRRA